jgi:hypothetical protein
MYEMWQAQDVVERKVSSTILATRLGDSERRKNDYAGEDLVTF